MADSVQETFDEMAKGITADQAEEIGAVYQFNITGDGGGSWTVDLTKDADYVTDGESENAQCTIELSAEDWLGIWNGEVNAMQAFMMGQLRVSGDMGLATKLQMLLEAGG